MNTHALFALTPDGRRIEIGRLGSLEKAVALGRRLYDELGDEYTRFELVELDPHREFIETIAATYNRDRVERDQAARRRS